jgi:phasin family protein
MAGVALPDGKQDLNEPICRGFFDQHSRDRPNVRSLGVHCAVHKIPLTAAVQHEILPVSSRQVPHLRCGAAAHPDFRSPPMAAETVKNTVDQFTTAGNVAFKDAVEKSLAQLNDFNTHSKKNLEAVIASVTASTKGVEALSAEAMAYSKKAVEDQVAIAKSLSGAKSIQEAVELQTTYAKSALDAYIAGVSKMSDIMTASVKDSMKPLNERVTAAVERLQAVR